MFRRKINRSELAKVIQKHLQWLESKGEFGEKADLSGCDLERQNLEKANLERANLEEANLRQAKLRTANLTAANLRGAILEEADFHWAIAPRVDLKDACLNGAILIYHRFSQSANRHRNITFTRSPSRDKLLAI